jgi:hypothetical protein
MCIICHKAAEATAECICLEYWTLSIYLMTYHYILLLEVITVGIKIMKEKANYARTN